MTPLFERSVFINCPFDDGYAPILQAMLFCIVYLDFNPRFATERNDAGENRLLKITELIENSRYSIHDLSRCQSKKIGEHFRLNMPLELGIDYGCKQYGGGGYGTKKFLILEEERFRYQAAISDLSGCDIEVHASDHQIAVRKVRNWLVNEADAARIAPSKIFGAYISFQEWHYEQQLEEGFSEDDIQDYPTIELLAAMKEWMKIGRP